MQLASKFLHARKRKDSTVSTLSIVLSPDCLEVSAIFVESEKTLPIFVGTYWVSL